MQPPALSARTRLLAGAVALVALVACQSKPAGSSSAVSARLSATVYSAPGFSIRPPEGWTQDDSGKLGSKVFFLGPRQSNFTVNINVISEPAQGTNVEQYVQAGKPQLAQALTGYAQVEDRALTVNGQPAHILGGTFKQGTFELRNRQLFVVRHDVAYVVTATALASTWSTYEALLDASIKTFLAV